MGKTHLMQAIGHYILFSNPKLKVKYTKTDDYINDYISYSRKTNNTVENMSKFYKKYNNIDVILIDDIQVIESKIKSMERLQHTFDTLYNKLESFDYVIIGLHDVNSYPKNFGLTDITVNFVDKICKRQKIVVDFFNSPLAINKFQNYKQFSSIVISYEDTPLAREISSDMIFGSLNFKGKLPLNVNNDFKEGQSITTENLKL